MEPLVIDWAREEAFIIFMFIANIISLFLSRLYDNFFSQVNSAEGMLPKDEL